MTSARRSQGGQEYAKRLEARELAKVEAEESEKTTKKAEGTKTSSEKKDQ